MFRLASRGPRSAASIRAPFASLWRDRAAWTALSLLSCLTLCACPSVSAGSAIGQAEDALTEAAPAGTPRAPERARFDWFQAKAFLDEARIRAGHGDWQQAQTYAVRARKAAESAQRRVGRLERE